MSRDNFHNRVLLDYFNVVFLHISAAKSRPRTNVDDLYKKAFDTMNEYMERKETRINKKASSVDSGFEPKKIKL